MIWNLGLFLAVAFVAYANGANDNFKGVATLFGSGTTDYRSALGWATLTTFTGSLFSLVLAGGLMHRFSGKGLVPDSVAASPLFLAAVALGAGGTVLLATWTGFPISTTHVSVGAISGIGMVTGQGNPRVILQIMLSWLLTLPMGALIGYFAFLGGDQL